MVWGRGPKLAGGAPLDYALRDPRRGILQRAQGENPPEDRSLLDRGAATRTLMTGACAAEIRRELAQVLLTLRKCRSRVSESAARGLSSSVACKLRGEGRIHG